jgi:hypothetical protein
MKKSMCFVCLIFLFFILSFGNMIKHYPDTCVAVAVVSQPVNQEMCSGTGSVSFSTGVSGDAPFTFQWQYLSAGLWANVVDETPSGAVYANQGTNMLDVSGISITGSYEYRCVVSNCSGSGHDTSDVATLTVNTVPGITSIIMGQSYPCAGTNMTYSVMNTPGVTYNWQLPSDWVQTGGGTTHTITVIVGTESGVITVTPSNSCGPGQQRIINVMPVTGIPSQPDTITGTISPCEGSLEYYHVTWVQGVTFSWEFPADWVATCGCVTSMISAVVGSDSGTISVTPSNACGTGTTQTLNVSPIPLPAQPSPVSGLQAPCEGSTQIYSVDSIPGITYLWTLPSDWIITGTNTSHTITVIVGQQSGEITVKPSNICGLGPGSSLFTTPVNFPGQPSAISGNINPCDGSDEIYSVANEPGVNFNWNLPQGWTLNDGQGTHSIMATASNTSGDVSVVAENNCGAANPINLPVTGIDIPPTPIVTLTGNILYSDAPTGNQWHHMNGPIQGATNPSYTPVENGEYYVIVTVNGCSSAPSDTVNVVLTGLGSNSISHRHFILTNPVVEDITIFYAGPNIVAFQIFNSTGTLVYSGEFEGQTTISRHLFSSGIYIIRLHNSLISETKRFVVH